LTWYTLGSKNKEIRPVSGIIQVNSLPNVQPVQPQVSSYLATIIDKKINHVALSCFERIVDWFMTLFSCCYPAYNNLYLEKLVNQLPRQIQDPEVVPEPTRVSTGVPSDFLAGTRDIASPKDRSENEIYEATATPPNLFLNHERYADASTETDQTPIVPSPSIDPPAKPATIDFEKHNEAFAFRWALCSDDYSITATHELIEDNQVPFSDKAAKMKMFRMNGGQFHSVSSFILDSFNTLRIYSTSASHCQNFYKEVAEKFGDKVYFSEYKGETTIYSVDKKILKDFFALLEKEPKLAYIDLEIEMAFIEFGMPSLTDRLKAIHFNTTELPEKFFDNIITFELMDDPVYAIVDEPLRATDLLPDGEIVGRHTYDRKTFELLNGICPVSNRPLKPIPLPNSRLKNELLQIVRQAEAEHSASKENA